MMIKMFAAKRHLFKQFYSKSKYKKAFKIDIQRIFWHPDIVIG